jgi:hypothetical protein
VRKPGVAAVAASKVSLPSGNPDRASVELVCLALVLAVAALGFRIASIW